MKSAVGVACFWLACVVVGIVLANMHWMCVGMWLALLLFAMSFATLNEKK